MQKRIRVLVVDDSAIARKVITESLADFPEIEVVGTAIDPYNARDRILDLKPDVLTLDIEMPKMDGLTFLRLIMQHRPMPVIIMSSLTTAGSSKAMEALEAGAVDVMDKPSGSFSAYEDGSRLAQKIKAAACARTRRAALDVAGRTNRPVGTTPAAVKSHGQGRSYHPRSLILIGSSTGGPEALNQLLPTFAGDLPGICIVQHIPAYFSKALAERLNHKCQLEVREAVKGDIVTPGCALIAPGGYHMILRWTGAHYLVELGVGPQLHHQRPAVDVLFDSVVKAGGSDHSTSVILTGMGSDGAAGLLRLRQAGSYTIAQDEESSVVFGMPREAIRLGAVDHVLPLDRMGAEIEKSVARLVRVGVRAVA
jgi:two-component system chemotaxis response regulator CheB